MTAITNQEIIGSVELSELYPYDLEDSNRAGFEKTLNLLGYIPMFSTATGSYRVVINIASTVVSAVKATFLLLADLFTTKPYPYPYRSYKHLTYIGHNLCNILRGCVEAVPLIGNACTFLYDCLIGRVSYDVEKTGLHYIVRKTQA